MELPVTTALIIGLLGSVHCIGMCGGIVGVLTAAGPGHREKAGPSFFYHLSYNAGRLSSYAVAGALAGALGGQGRQLPVDAAVPVGAMITALFMIALGLYLGGWWRAVAGLEQAGAYLWRRIRPWGQHFMPVRHPGHAFGLGLVWGWLPCGLVYSALALALVSGEPIGGALVMLAFGTGTLPVLLALGNAGQRLGAVVRHPFARRAAGALVIVFGLYAGAAAFDHGGVTDGAPGADAATCVAGVAATPPSAGLPERRPDGGHGTPLALPDAELTMDLGRPPEVRREVFH